MVQEFKILINRFHLAFLNSARVVWSKPPRPHLSHMKTVRKSISWQMDFQWSHVVPYDTSVTDWLTGGLFIPSFRVKINPSNCAFDEFTGDQPNDHWSSAIPVASTGDTLHSVWCCQIDKMKSVSQLFHRLGTRLLLLLCHFWARSLIRCSKSSSCEDWVGMEKISFKN